MLLSNATMSYLRYILLSNELKNKHLEKNPEAIKVLTDEYRKMRGDLALLRTVEVN